MPDHNRRLSSRLPVWLLALFLAVRGAETVAELLAELRHWIPIIFG